MKHVVVCGLDVVLNGTENDPLLDVTSKAGVRWYRMAESSYTRVRIGAHFVGNHDPVNTARIKLIHEDTALSALRQYYQHDSTLVEYRSFLKKLRFIIQR